MSLLKEKKEIGSNYWINPNESKNFNYNFIEQLKKRITRIEDYSYTHSGRSAISLVLKQLTIKNKIALLPRYSCSTVIYPFINAGYKIVYYDINKNMELDYEQIITLTSANDISVFLFHDYFGFNTHSQINKIIETLRIKNITTIEDITQNMFSEYDLTDSDYHIGSIRKWFGIPDGGLIISRNSNLEYKPLEIFEELVNISKEAFHIKYKYINHDIGTKDDYNKFFIEANKLLNTNTDIFKISNFSKDIINSKNVSNLKSKRRNNYLVLLDKLSSVNQIKIMFQNLEENITPLYFPIFVKDRKEFQVFMAKNDVYLPIIWHKDEIFNVNLNSDVDFLYKNMIMIPCDQRYDKSDMERISKLIYKYYKLESQS